MKAKKRYLVGLDKLAFASSQVHILLISLISFYWRISVSIEVVAQQIAIDRLQIKVDISYFDNGKLFTSLRLSSPCTKILYRTTCVVKA